MTLSVMRKEKYTGNMGRWPAYEVATDERGRWLYCPKGTLYRGHPVKGDPVDIEVGQGAREEGLDVMHLIPHEGWWVAAWWELSGTRQITIDICTPAELNSGEWRYVDLELDPYWTSDGAVGVDDWDEFEAGCDSGTISAHEAAAGRQAAADLLASLKEGIEPFGDEGWSRYENALALDLAPLRELPPLAVSAGTRAQPRTVKHEPA